MILYSLACEAGHRFESWFGGSAAFDQLAARGALLCPTCGSSHVAKTIMAPAVFSKRGLPSAEVQPTAVETSSETKPDSTAVTVPDDKRREMRSMIKAFREKIMAETQDVGTRFPDQARRMHDGDIPHREIRGQATIDEAKSLLEDGIFILPLPSSPDELN